MKGKNLFIGLALLVFGASCSDNGTATVKVTMIDAPADFDKVVVDLVDVQVNTSSDEEKGWLSLENANMGKYDLLELTNGTDAFLGDIILPEGKLSQIRMILGTENVLTVDGTETALTTPSAQQTGLKLNVNADIVGGVTYNLVIDFDAAKSVVSAGSGKYNLKPVIRAEMEASSGSIGGAITPADTEAVVYAITGQDSVSTYPDVDGNFLIAALAEGTYSVVAVPSTESQLEAITVDNVAVVIGEKADAGTIDFSQGQ